MERISIRCECCGVKYDCTCTKEYAQADLDKAVAEERARIVTKIREMKNGGYQKAASPPCHHRDPRLRCDTYRLIREAMEDAWRLAALIVENEKT